MLTVGKARELRWRDWSITPAELAAETRMVKFALHDGFRQTVRWWRETQGLSL
jgi:hypothetical protein